MQATLGCLSAATLALALTVVTPPALACNGNGKCANAPGHVKGAPGPMAGAGLPVLATGYGVYWLFERRSKVN
jgi:hypothetical protein